MTFAEKLKCIGVAFGVKNSAGVLQHDFCLYIRNLWGIITERTEQNNFGFSASWWDITRVELEK